MTEDRPFDSPLCCARDQLRTGDGRSDWVTWERGGGRKHLLGDGETWSWRKFEYELITRINGLFEFLFFLGWKECLSPIHLISWPAGLIDYLWSLSPIMSYIYGNTIQSKTYLPLTVY